MFKIDTEELDGVAFWGMTFVVLQLFFIPTQIWFKWFDNISIYFKDMPLNSTEKSFYYCLYFSVCIVVFGGISLYCLDKHNTRD